MKRCHFMPRLSWVVPLGLVLAGCAPSDTSQHGAPALLPGLGTMMPPWALDLGSRSTDSLTGVAVDDHGDILVTGFFQQAMNLAGQDTLVSAGGFDVYVAKLTRRGALLWDHRYGGPGDDLGTAIAVDGDGNVVLAATFQGTADFGTGPLTSAGGADVALAKYSPEGVPLWSRSFGGPLDERAFAVAADADGNIALAGAFAGTAEFGGSPLVSAGGKDLFVGAYAPDGSYRWALRAGGSGDDGAFGVTIGEDGAVAVTGSYSDGADLDPPLRSAAQGLGAFVIEYVARGQVRALRTFDGPGNDGGGGVIYDQDGNLVVTGAFQSSVDFGAATLRSAGQSDIFLVKLSSGSAMDQTLYARRYGGPGDDVGFAVAPLPQDGVAVAGVFQDTVNFGGGAVTSAGGYDAFAAAYGLDGRFRYAQRLGGPLDDRAFAVSASQSGEVAVGGDFQGSGDFAGTTLTSWGGADAFLALLPVADVTLTSLTVTKETPPACAGSAVGSGTVTSSPGGINCGPQCTAQFNDGAKVTLTATPGKQSVFAGWTGACAGQGNPCTLTLHGEEAVTATFQAVCLTVSKNTPPTCARYAVGSGTITSSPAGINCGEQCSARFNDGAAVTLTVTPSKQSVFTGWTGACAGQGNPCTLTLHGGETTTATLQPVSLALLVDNPGGGGYIDVAPGGTRCGGGGNMLCCLLFDLGTTVTLTPDYAPNVEFVGWGGACSGSTPTPCVLTLEGPTSASAFMPRFMP